MDESSQVTGVATVLDVQWNSSPSLLMQTIPILQGDALPHDEISDNSLFMVVNLDGDLIERFLQEDGGLTRLLMDITDVSLYLPDAKMVLALHRKLMYLNQSLVHLEIWSTSTTRQRDKNRIMSNLPGIFDLLWRHRRVHFRFSKARQLSPYGFAIARLHSEITCIMVSAYNISDVGWGPANLNDTLLRIALLVGLRGRTEDSKKTALELLVMYLSPEQTSSDIAQILGHGIRPKEIANACLADLRSNDAHDEILAKLARTISGLDMHLSAFKFAWAAPHLVTRLIKAGRRQLCCGDPDHSDMTSREVLLSIRNLLQSGSQLGSLSNPYALQYIEDIEHVDVFPLVVKCFNSAIANTDIVMFSVIAFVLRAHAQLYFDLQTSRPAVAKAIFEHSARSHSMIQQNLQEAFIKFSDEIPVVSMRAIRDIWDQHCRIIGLDSTTLNRFLSETPVHILACDRKDCPCAGSSHKPPHAMRACKGCRKVYYCTTVCQEADWKAGHRRVCRRLRE